jgi:hypothetical protein
MHYKLQAYAETGRVLKQGGAFIFNAWDNFDHNPAAQLTQEVVTEFFPVDILRGCPRKFFKFPKSLFNL